MLDNPEWKVQGFGEALATKCLAIVYPDRWVPLFIYRGENGKRAVMRLPELPVEPLDETGEDRAPSSPRSRTTFCATSRGLTSSDDPWGAMVFLWWLLKYKQDEEELFPQEADLDVLADELLLPVEWLREVLELLEDKKQVIFYGPPGTGKTFVARAIARFIAPDDQHRKTAPVPSELRVRGLHRGLPPRR